MDGDAKRIIERLREITAKIGVPVNLPAGREIEIHAKPGEVPVMRFDKAGRKFKGFLTGATFKRKPQDTGP